MNRLQRRYITLDASECAVEAKGDETILRGYAAKFDSLSGSLFEKASGIREIIRKGFFRSALDAPGRILALFNHNENFILGERTAGTLIVDEDKTGLAYEVRLSDSQTVLDMVIKPIQRGEIRGCSFSAFIDYSSVEYDRKADVYQLMPGGCEMLADVGPVTWPAYEDTEIQARAALYRRMKTPARNELEMNELEMIELFKYKLETGV